MRNRLLNSLAGMWRALLWYGALFGVLGALLYIKLGTLLPGYSGAEALQFQASISLEYIFNHPLNAPFALVTNGLTYLGDHSYLLTRLTATVFGLITLVAFYALVQRWFGRRTALLGTVLFGTSAWFLHMARLGEPEVLLFGAFTLVACSLWLKAGSNPVALLLCFAVTVALLYVPGMIWLLLLITLWYWRAIDRVFKQHLLVVSVGAFMLLAALAPIGWAIYQTPQLWKTYAGLPAEGWPQILDVLRNLYEIPLSFFVQFSGADPARWLGTLAILDVFTTAMVFLGGFVCLKHWRLKRVRLLGLMLLAGWLLASLGGGVTLTVMVPFMYVLAAIGAGLLVDRWFTVFPRNPIAQGLGLGLVGIAVLAASSYHLRHYFVAWPSNTATRAVYSIPEPTSVKME